MTDIYSDLGDRVRELREQMLRPASAAGTWWQQRDCARECVGDEDRETRLGFRIAWSLRRRWILSAAAAAFVSASAAFLT